LKCEDLGCSEVPELSVLKNEIGKLFIRMQISRGPELSVLKNEIAKIIYQNANFTDLCVNIEQMKFENHANIFEK
jgi:hypothetical protein